MKIRDETLLLIKTINNRLYVSKLKILLEEYVFLHGHKDYENVKQMCDIMTGRDYETLKENNSNAEI